VIRSTPKFKVAASEAANPNDPRWAAIVARDASADGRFVYSVRTTGVYCRPSCAARRARFENVSFHATCADAERAGFRPCLRCKPNGLSQNEQIANKIAAVCRLIEEAEEKPTLQKLAEFAQWSTYHMQRVFKATTGVSPAEYAAAQRGKRIHRTLKEETTVTDAIYAAGYASSSRFYETSTPLLGMTPSNYREGGAGANVAFAIGECSLGSVLVARSERGICAILLGDDSQILIEDLSRRFPLARITRGETDFEKLLDDVIQLVDSPRKAINLPLDIKGTAFQRRVWQALRKIPAGSTATYSDISKSIGAPKSVRAVARACAENPIAVAIPCHRVIAKNGSLAGYRWGLERKRKLLDGEAKSQPASPQASS
jgi:AraC family transcriptional regulator of adaptative response/methylated-DNA-[protein]-cysteine methyltransferase